MGLLEEIYNILPPDLDILGGQDQEGPKFFLIVFWAPGLLNYFQYHFLFDMM